MKLTLFAAALCVCCTVAVAAQVQTQQQPPARQPVPASTLAPETPASAPVAKLVIKEGTDVKLKFAQTLSSKTAEEGDPVNFVLAEDLVVEGVTVAKEGAKGLGTITNSKKAGMMGKAGELNLRLEYVIVADKHMRIRGTKGKEGQGKEGTAVALTVLFGPLGLMKHGKNVEVKEGTPIAAFVDEDFTMPQ